MPLFFCLHAKVAQDSLPCQIVWMKDTPFSLSVELNLPAWISAFLTHPGKSYPTDEDKMNLVLALAMENVNRETGGPFGAAIFDAMTDRVVSVGVNRVVPLNNSTAHAEMMAFMLAQHRLGRFRLDTASHDFLLVTSAQPCAMCYGACPWAGIRRVVIGARREDVESLTEFDEGPMPEDWVAELNRRGIRVTQDVLRGDSRKVLDAYAKKKGTQY